MQADYAESIQRVLKSEGGYVNNPRDPGGPTNFGITIADYRRYAKPSATAADVRAMQVDEAKTIYKSKYWNAMACDALPAGVDYCIFDYGVNSGTGRAPKVLRRVVNLPDSAPLSSVLTALTGRDKQAVVNAICDERLRFLKSLRTWPTFGAGWQRRVRDVRVAALHMAEQPESKDRPMPADPIPSAPQGKGEAPKPDTSGPIIVGGGTAGTAGGATAWDWITAHPIASVAIAAVALVLVVIVAEVIARSIQRVQQNARVPVTPVPAIK